MTSRTLRSAAAIAGLACAASCAQILGLGDIHDGICTPGSSQACAYTGPPETENVGVCHAGSKVCGGDGQSYGACAGEVLPAPAEDCSNHVDDDCNGMVNDGCVCTAGTTEACYSGPAGTEGKGICHGGMHTCDKGDMSFGPCTGEQTPLVEDCNTPGDEDCDGIACSDPVWDVISTDTFGESVTGMATDSQGDVYLAGFFGNTLTIGGMSITAGAGNDFFLAKLDHATGATLWLKRFGDGAGYSLSVAVDAMDDVVLAGELAGSVDFGAGPLTSYGMSDAFVAKLDGQGNYKWAKHFGDTAYQTAGSVATDAQNNIYVSGTFFGSISFGLGGPTFTNSTTNDHAFFVKFDENGMEVWSKGLSDPMNDAPGNFFPSGIVADPSDPGACFVTGDFDKGLDLGGSTFFTNGGSDVFLAKFDPMGNHVWSQQFGSPGDDRPGAIAANASGSVAISGQYGGTINFGTGSLTSQDGTGFVATFDKSGVPHWSKGLKGITGSWIALDTESDVLLASSPNGNVDLGAGPLTSGGGYDVVVGKLKGADGSVVWNKIFGDAKDQFAFGIALDPASGNVAIGGQAAGEINFGLTPLTSNSTSNAFVAVFQP